MKLIPVKRTNEEYEAFAALEQLEWADFAPTVEMLKHWDKATASQYIRQSFAVEIDGQIMGRAMYGHTVWAFEPGKFYLYIMIHPDYRRQGLGTAIYQQLLAELAQHRPVKLLVGTREDKPSALAFLQKEGFTQVMRYPLSRLDLTEFDPGRYTTTLQRVADSGITIRTIEQLAKTDPDYRMKIYEMDRLISQDVPHFDEPTPPTFEQYQKYAFDNPGYLPNAWFVALDGQEYVGLSNLWRNFNNDKRWDTGFTGVKRSHRRRGIATALKVNILAYAKSQGITTTVTDNEENNPMFLLNMQLGFVPQPANLDFIKNLTAQV